MNNTGECNQISTGNAHLSILIRIGYKITAYSASCTSIDVQTGPVDSTGRISILHYLPLEKVPIGIAFVSQYHEVLSTRLFHLLQIR